ncbi:hypothetical protein PF002_g17839 [Phytophthora fragariae]|uniref:Uncharacterized protein n=1 Tax=Phytophthora fragariae TaxID=53985 RepID=A0A6A3Y7Z8_9STRA|nr:hypothetical protein PF009_g17811 [Phytophthora fragariae]KAE9213834.1 hypothetical protein PF002_g17839 [Phytophthora fragariae]
MLELAPEDFMEPGGRSRAASPRRAGKWSVCRAQADVVPRLAVRRTHPAYRLSSKKHHLVEAKAEAFLIKTIDDQHVLFAKENNIAFDLFRTICSNYEGSAVHGDQYYIQSYLMNCEL